ncbi:head-tail adaptor protein [Mesorhizobium sp. 1M-11]|uniref:head-tail adaptor protein n=1 Tax=Mesorhizobium sp. 1M-11 TaxID=1529006 RepID=UPI0006C74583|nr:head-tail adaptor protein [Mesorhizobium sp. 1M-11]
MTAGQLRELVTLQYATLEDDGAGNEIPTWHDIIVPARIRYLKGSEEIIAARLTGVQPIVITIRNGGPAAAVTTDWRAIITRTAETLQIRSKITDERGAWIDLLCQSGVPA